MQSKSEHDYGHRSLELSVAVPVYWELFVGPKYKMILDEGQISQNDYYEISMNIQTAFIG